MFLLDFSRPIGVNMDDLIGFDLGGGSLEVIEVRNRLPRPSTAYPWGNKNRFAIISILCLKPRLVEIDAYLSSTLSELD